jgi:hypothetical protein
MKKVALIIIYNHRYDNNIEILERIYEKRFGIIYHLMPFYRGNRKNVLPVYESPHYFQGYVAQGFKSFFNEEYTHYLFVADDLILNPMVTENNYAEIFNLSLKGCFIPRFANFNEAGSWPRVRDAYFWNIKSSGVEAVEQLPDYATALQKFKKFGLELRPLQFQQIWTAPDRTDLWLENFFQTIVFTLRSLHAQLKRKTYSLPYPAVASYSDIFVVSSDVIGAFSHFCGVFAATRLFAEVAVPTALVLSAEEIVTDESLRLQGKPLWTAHDFTELEKYDHSLEKLLAEFPAKYLYLHPIKLSQWKIGRFRGMG